MSGFGGWTRQSLERFADEAVAKLIEQNTEIDSLRMQLQIAKGAQEKDAKSMAADAIRKAAAK